MDDIKYVIGSHQDPDILASMPRWLIHLQHTKLLIPTLWERFLPHYSSAFTKGRLHHSLSSRLEGIPDTGGVYPLGNTHIMAIPAHFLHSVGNVQFYDPVSQILFSGDMGASLIGHSGIAVNDFQAHTNSMQDFHTRYMTTNKAIKLWANSVRRLPIDMIVPQHGKRFEGCETIAAFFEWISQLSCGIDLIDEHTYDIAHLAKAAKVTL